MSSDAEIERLIEALQQDGPSDRDAARLRARLAGIGIATGAGLAQGTAAASMPAAKAAASAGVGLSTRWATLSLLPKMAIVATVAATAVGGPLVAVELRERATAEHAPAATRAHDGAPRTAERAPERSGTAADLGALTELAEHGGADIDTSGAGVTRAADEAPPRVNGTERAVRAARADGAQVARTGVAAEQAAAPVVATAGAPVLAAATTTEVAASSDNATARFAENPAPASPPRASSLAEETALIDAAFAALRVQDAATAAALVAEHARRFPRGLLWRERERARQKLATVRGASGG